MSNQPHKVTASPSVVGGAPIAWVVWSTRVLVLAGLGVATYLTIVHFNTRVSLACPNTGVINCEKVTTSQWSEVFGIPVALLGAAFFATQALLALPWSWRNPKFDLVRIAMAGVGVLFVLWLVYAEIVKIGSICLWCTSVHVITVTYFLILLYSALSYSRYTLAPVKTDR
ncbi:MAG: vitamin K epoxide reductase family protein [Ferrimicrobium sp.]